VRCYVYLEKTQVSGGKIMNYRKVQEEFVVVFCQNEDGMTLRVAIRQQVEACPDCREKAAMTRRMVAIVRTHCSHQAPRDLRSRILSCLPHRCGNDPSPKE